jgi:hypothetical protein
LNIAGGRLWSTSLCDVVDVEGRGMSKKKKTFIAIGAGAAIFAAMFAYAFTHIWND